MQDELRNAIKILSKRYGIEATELRIKISKPAENDDGTKNKDLKYHIMKKNEIVDETNLASALNLNTAQAFFADVKLNSVFNKISVNNQIEKSRMNVRIYTDSEDYEPKLYLFEGKEPKRKLQLEELK